MSKIATLTINSHNIVFTKIHPYLKEVLDIFCKRLILYDRKRGSKYERMKVVKKSIFAASTMDRREIRFHINHKEELLNFIKNEGYSEDRLNIVKTLPYEGVSTEFKIKDDREPFPYQIPLIQYILEDGIIKAITLGTGDGKTFVALMAIAKMKKRVLIVILGRYVKKWIKDIENAFYIKKGDLLVVRGSSHFIDLMNLAIANELNAKIIIVTSNTMQRYIKDYEHDEQKGYPIEPPNLLPALGIGMKLIDETHQFFHLNFKMDLYSHVAKEVHLSATLEPSDSFLNKMYKVMYPIETRMQGKARDRYIDVTAISYKIHDSHKVRCTFEGKYSHTVFEKQILRNRRLLNSYLNIIWHITKTNFVELKADGQKMLILAATTELCSKIRGRLSERFPDLRVEKYTFGDPEENLHESDITISTFGSAGTAVDILNLKTCLMTNSIFSKQQNIQTLGRLRKLINYPDDNPEFIYIYSSDIEKQLSYHLSKYKFFKGLCRSHKNYDSNFSLNYY